MLLRTALRIPLGPKSAIGKGRYDALLRAARVTVNENLPVFSICNGKAGMMILMCRA